MSGRIDGWLILAAVSIFGASLANLYAVSPAVGRGLFLRQAVFGCVALVLFWVCSSIRVTAWQQAAPMLYGVGLALLLAVLLVGEVRSGTRGWFVVGPLSLQPSEFARVATMLLVAAQIGGREEPRLGRSGTIGLLLILLAPIALILVEPDLGVALTYTPIFAAGLWLGGGPDRPSGRGRLRLRERAAIPTPRGLCGIPPRDPDPKPSAPDSRRGSCG